MSIAMISLDWISVAIVGGEVIVVLLLALVALCTTSSPILKLGAPQSVYGRLSEYHFYKDEDGEAVEESLASYNGKFPSYHPAICAFVGLVVSVIGGAWSISDGYRTRVIQQWLDVGGWSLVLVQSIVLRIERLPIQRYKLGILIAMSVTILLLGFGWDTFRLLVQLHYGRTSFVFYCTCNVLQLGTCIFMIALSLGIQRRPDVYWNGDQVDGQFSVSALKRYTFAWAEAILALGKARVDFAHLPHMDYNSRAENLEKHFRLLQSSTLRSLWLVIYLSHRSVLIWQWFLTIAQSVVTYAPQFCLYKLLKLLELRHNSGEEPTQLWVWVVGLGLLRLVQTILEARLTWISFATLAISIRSQLSAAIFHKSMRMKLYKSSGGSKQKLDQVQNEQSTMDEENEDQSLLSDGDRDGIPLQSYKQDNSKPQLLDSKELSSTSTQETINLLSVDAQRVANFYSYNNIYLSIFVNLIIAVWFLVSLIGWISLCVGLLAPILLMPLNTMASKAYNSAQGSMMAARDDKVAAIAEIIAGIRQIKFSATEEKWQKKVMEIRDIELEKHWKIYFWALALRFCWIASPIFLSVFALATYSWINGELSAAVAFTSLAVFGNLEWCLSVVPLAISQMLDASVSIKRIQKLMNEDDKHQNTMAGENIEFKNSIVAWPEHDNHNDRFKLGTINAKFPNGELSIIYGKSGCGKTLMLSSMLGETDLLSGEIFMPKPSSTEVRSHSKADGERWIIPSSIAYVAQTPWIENATIKDNILFGLPLDLNRYHDVLEAAALRKDIDMLSDGDLTEIGAQGINLSGGQRWRVTFGRALYSRAGILILDDILSAVDSHVGRHIFEKGLTGSLGQGRTRILATHHVALCLPKATSVVHIDNNGTVRQTLGANPTLPSGGQYSRWNETYANDYAGHDRNIDMKSENGAKEIMSSTPNPLRTPKAFVEDEFREQGTVKWLVYSRYLSASGGIALWIFSITAIAASQFALLGRAWWMKLWTETESSNSSSGASTSFPRLLDPTVTITSAQEAKAGPKSVEFFLGIYMIISLVSALMEVLKCYLVYTGGLRASRGLFKLLIYNVLRARLRWLDTVPGGRILNRFTSDFTSIDSQIPSDTHNLLTAITSLLIIFITGLSLSYYMVVPYFALLGICLLYTRSYIASANEIKRLEAIARSPILELYSTSLLGLDTIRAYSKANEYTSRMFSHIDDFSRSSWAFWLISQWMSFRMGIVGALFTLCVAIAIVKLDRVDASLAGFVLLYALNYSKGMEDTIRRINNFQLNMNSVERVVEFSSLDTEEQVGSDVPDSWPSEGHLSIKRLEVKYSLDLPPALKGLSVDITPRQRVGIVGRTGAGKSSITLALFRCLEASAGKITIDGEDISKIKLSQLRSRLAIIPQDAVLFSGTIRSNLDPLNQYRDAELFESLRRVHLIGSPLEKGEMLITDSLNMNVFENLDSHVSEGGLNLSQGQRQLLCLARAILTRAKIMIMDEATSAVDMATDLLIQRSIREHFSESTLVVIAHRLSTVADFDRILVVADGRALEYDDPKTLLTRKGEFWRMVMESGEREKIEGIIMQGQYS